MEDRLPFESELIARIDWLIRLRWLAVVGTVLAIGLGALWFPGTLAVAPLLGVTAVIALYNLLFSLYQRSLKSIPVGTVRLQHATVLAYVQIVMDLGALAVLLHFSGGVENPLALFFVFHVIIASILLRWEASFLMAGLASLLFVAVVVLEYAGVVDHYHLPITQAELYREPLYLFAASAALTLALFLAVYLTTSIAIRLRERGRDLLESNLTCQIWSQELEELNEQLRQVDNERTRFMVLVTHELRAPISTIYSALELARSGYASAEKTQEVLGRAQDRAAELLELISDLLNLTQVRERAVRLEDASPVRVDAVLLNVVEFVQVEAAQKNVMLEVDVESDLAPVRALPDQLRLVWTNLLSNALKYNRPGGIVRVSLRQDETQVIGSVQDTGIGIAQEDLSRVFNEFFRASNARRVSPHGSGVGLAVVRRIIENWGGRIWVESEAGHGSTFTFVLPRSDV